MVQFLFSLFIFFSFGNAFASQGTFESDFRYIDSGMPQFKRVVTVVFENASYTEALSQAYFKSIANSGALFTQFFAETHPSQANYIAMIAGDTLGVWGDAPVNLNGNHIGNLLEAKGLTWKTYAEDLPSNCFLDKSQNKYARKHVPFLSFTNVQKFPNECAKVVEGAQFFIDQKANALPNYSLYIPNLNHDGHDTNADEASKWFSDAFNALLSDSQFMKDTLFVVTFDESDHYAGPNQIYTVLLGANITPGAIVDVKTSHYSILKMIEDQFLLGNLGRKDADAIPITGIWK